MLFFCDESGQTGSNYLDKTQPFYVLGGWLVPDDVDMDKLEKCIYISSTEEIKASKLCKTQQGRKRILELLNICMENNFIPIKCIVEKKFAIAARIVDELMDPMYNSLVPERITYDELEMKKYDLARIFYTLPDELLQKFANAYSNSDINEITLFIQECSLYLEKVGEKQLSKIIYNALIKIRENSSFIKQADDEGTFQHKIDSEKAQKSVNWFSFYTLQYILDEYASKRDILINIIHDEQDTYDTSFKSMFSLVTKGEDKKIRFQGKDRRVIFNALRDLEFKDSKSSILIQLADVLVGSINYVLRTNSNENERIDETLKKLSIYVFELIYKYPCHSMTSIEQISKIIKHIDAKEIEDMLVSISSEQ